MSLDVYKSSAGSGKTTTLVNEYLKIALKNPHSFRHILAITFTNKAANEMKERVISVLKELSSKDIKNSPKLFDLIQYLNYDEFTLMDKSKYLLSLILNNYDDFAISTIDSFIHRIIRTFASDVSLPQNFEVVIDKSDLIPQILKGLYGKVGKDITLTNFLVGFVMSEADEENNYDPTSRLIDFIDYQINEDGFFEIKKIDNLSLKQLNKIISALKSEINKLKSNIIEKSNEALNICSDRNLEAEDFYQGNRGIYKYFTNLSEFKISDEKLFPGKNAIKTITEGNWYSSKVDNHKKELIDSITEELGNLFEITKKKLESYLHFRLLFSKIYSLALIHEIRKLFFEFTDKSGKIHISEFNKRISNQISDQPVPFIYERLGRKYRYFLLDEFQDTSILQWQNLLPLIEESLSQGNKNLLVGDAKQAIYRFRNGEVELFANLPELYNREKTNLKIESENTLKRFFNSKSLDTNYRSREQIIEFNNDFFEVVSSNLSQRTKTIYSELKQNFPSKVKNGGIVSIRFSDYKSESFEETKLSKIKSIIKEANKKNYGLDQICILCRTKKNASQIFEYLISNKIDVVSNESLLLTNSPGVRLLVAFLKLNQNPNNQIALAEFIDGFIKFSDNSLEFNTEYSELTKFKLENLEPIFLRYNVDTSTKMISAYSVFEMVEFALRSFSSSDTTDIFIQYFLDFVFENNIDLDEFLSLWESKKNKIFISMPENIAAVQIMTIHKAKGLDFPIVIVDAENRAPKTTKSEYWEPLNIEGISDLKVGLMPINKKLNLIGRGDIYEIEEHKSELDFLNLIYVAFTRPKHALYIIGETNSKDQFSKYLIDYLDHKRLWEKDKVEYEFGSLPLNSEDSEISNGLILNKFVSEDWTKLISVAPSENIKSDLISSKSSRAYGKLIHRILASIYYEYDLYTTFANISDSEILSTSEIDIIKDLVSRVIAHPELKRYFQEDLIIKNETEILLEDGTTVRPDKVVIDKDKLTIIDYKTGEEKNEDILQIKGYKKVFQNLNYKDIEAKLVYLNDEIKIIQV
ncbi:MAG: UvrD-helicase domain-containing protein [Lentimicrobiaceae bacterium]|mgnify:FL=1|nr:UvrD-helicase domain-containing protein [Lentimicrobiaceae bacterium]